MRYRLRTLLVLLAVGPPISAWVWSKYSEYIERQRVAAQQAEMNLVLSQILYDTSQRTVWQGKLLDDLIASQGDTPSREP